MQNMFCNCNSILEKIIFIFSSFRLLTKNRKAIEINSINHDWKEYSPEEYKQPEVVYGAKSVFPMHGLLRLKPIDERTKKRLKRHCEELRNL